MKKIINSSLYDTEKAAKLGAWDSGHPVNDFNYFSEVLHKTKSGKYFLHGAGGGLSRYGEWVGNSGYGSEKIMPMTMTEAQKWAEEHLDGDEYIAIFGEPEDGKALRAFMLSNAAIRRLAELQAERGGSLSAVVEALIMGEKR